MTGPKGNSQKEFKMNENLKPPSPENVDLGTCARIPFKILQFRTAAILGFSGVALGAFGAHGLESRLQELNHVETWKTAVFYHLIHTSIIAVAALLPGKTQFVFRCFTLGILLFSGSLYLLALTDFRILGAVTPFGGLCFLIGWWMLALKAGEMLYPPHK